jgi:hypothetical protein
LKKGITAMPLSTLNSSHESLTPNTMIGSTQRRNTTAQNHSASFHGGASLIRTALVVFVIIVALGYFDLDLQSIVESEQVQKNLGYVKNFIVGFWENILRPPLVIFWDFLRGIFSRGG